ncbi:MAG: rhamnulokinase [Alphaproteobacteria bacterium]|jgi:rhamnulokinase|nr:rhamnulokinase [Alphaproteobacteria bacterium]
MARTAYLAFDLGAESGRAMLGVLDSGRITLHEVHRFANTLHPLPDGLHWNTLGLFADLKEGLAQATRYCADNALTLVSAGVDTWGVDFGLIGHGGGLLGIPFAYRDPRNEAAMQHAFDVVGREKLYARTGIQIMPINSLYQLVAHQQAEPQVLAAADRLLFTPDLLHYLLTGVRRNESSIASTSQMIDPTTGAWATDLLEALGLPTGMLGEIVRPGTVIGPLRDDVAEEVGADGRLRIITPACHDTASAVAAVPADPASHWAYLSSGTWSLLGVELNEPVVTPDARQAEFTNEGGVDGTIRFLTNIMGLWLVQECRRAFEKQGRSYDYEQLAKLAEDAQPFGTLVSPQHGPFLQPGDMPAKIDAFAESTNQPRPASVGQYVRCCLESLALTYRHTIGNLQKVRDHPVDVIHVVGGGGKNELLNQMTADATGCRVVVGPYEATAAGNVLVQAMGAGDVADLAEIRGIVRASFSPKTYQPADTAGWDEAYERYARLVNFRRGGHPRGGGSCHTDRTSIACGGRAIAKRPITRRESQDANHKTRRGNCVVLSPTTACRRAGRGRPRQACDRSSRIAPHPPPITHHSSPIATPSLRARRRKAEAGGAGLDVRTCLWRLGSPCGRSRPGRRVRPFWASRRSPGVFAAR